MLALRAASRVCGHLLPQLSRAPSAALSAPIRPLSSTAADWPLGRDVTVICHDPNGLVAFCKPPGGLSHPNNKSSIDRRALLRASYNFDGEFFEWTNEEQSCKLWLLNRLDSATSGVILAATSANLASQIKSQFKHKTVQKLYRAIVFGTPRQQTEVWCDTLSVQKDKARGQIRTVQAAVGSAAESRMSVVCSGAKNGLTMLQLEPLTGKSHQLRSQCAGRKLCIVGDQTYGNFARNRALAKDAKVPKKRMFLHSLQTSFSYEFNGVKHDFVAHAPLPTDFETLMASAPTSQPKAPKSQNVVKKQTVAPMCAAVTSRKHEHRKRMRRKVNRMPRS